MGELKIFDVNIPIDEETTLVKFVALRTFFKGKWADRDARRRVFKVLYEDQAIVDTVRPELLPFDLSDELHVKSDYNAVLYRRRRQELIEMGWGVEGNTIVGEGPARVEQRVIPSPIRKEVPELASAWNFKEVRSREILARQRRPDRARRRPAHRLPRPATESDHRGDQGMTSLSGALCHGTLDTLVERGDLTEVAGARRRARSSSWSPRRSARSARPGSSAASGSPRPCTSASRCRRSGSTATWCSRSARPASPVPHFTLDSVFGQGHLRLPPRPDPARRPRHPPRLPRLGAHAARRGVRGGRRPTGATPRPPSARASSR